VNLDKRTGKQLADIDNSIYPRIAKKLLKMTRQPPKRHLKNGLNVFIEEVGQYRIAYELVENRKEVFFIGKHKDYERWYRSAPVSTQDRIAA